MEKVVTGVDRLYLTSSEIRPEFKSVKWTEKTISNWVESIDPHTGEVTEEQTTSSQKFLNFKEYGLGVSLNSQGLLFQFNPNRIITNTHYQIRPIADIDEAVDKVQNICRTKGLDVDLNTFKISHIDLCRQNQMNHPFEAYLPFLRQINGKRLDSYEYPNSYYFENSQSEGVLYDKSYQAKKLFKENVPDRTMRFEHRHKNGRSVQSNLKANTIQGLKQIDIDAVFNNYAQRIFKPEIQLNIYPYLSQLEQYIRRGKKDSVINFLHHMSMASGGVKGLKQTIIETFGTMDALREAIRISTGYYHSNRPYAKSRERQNWSDLMRRIDADDRFYQMNFVNEEERPINLKDELFEKFQLTA